jgi:hypothetical protein
MIPAAGVRELRNDMLDDLAVARARVKDANTPGEIDEARSHLNFVCDLLDALGWEDREPEQDIPVEGIRVVLRHHLEVERELADTHNEDQRARAETMIVVIERLLHAIAPPS